MDIPILIISYNNYRYVDNTLKQIKKINENYYRNIIIIDNKSTDINTINYLKNLKDIKVIHRTENGGPRISLTDNTDLYNILPSKFILTDPDLQFNPNLPTNFIDILSKLSDKYRAYKIGFALDISDIDKMYKGIYFLNGTIYDTEITFWTNKINDNDYELYNAITDTTFCLINKENFNITGKDPYPSKNIPWYANNDIYIRIAGNFLAKHIPWYIDNEIYNIYNNYNNCISQTEISSIKDMILKYINENYIKINKNNELFFVKNKNNIKYWENEKLDIYDKYLDNNKIVIEIGSFIGTKSTYFSRKSKYLYCIELNKENEIINELKENLKNNCENNYTIINIDNDKKVIIEDIIKKNNININEISFIKIDIEGIENEEYLRYLNNFNKLNKIPIFIEIYNNNNKYEFLKLKN